MVSGSSSATTIRNTITVSGVSFDRSVKIQFSSGAVSFDALTLNGSSVYNPSSYAVSG